MRDKVQIAAVPAATWGDARARTAEENPALPAPPLPIVGATLDPLVVPVSAADSVGRRPGSWRCRSMRRCSRTARIRRQRFGDVRIVDAEGRQIPYLVERASEPLSIDLTIERLSDLPKALADRRPPPSVYRIAWPFEQLPAPRLVLSTSARVFQRPVTSASRASADRSHRDAWVQSLATVVWSHADQDRPTPALTIALPSEKMSQLLVILDEGDNSPIPLTGAKLLLPAYRLRFFRERGASLRLAYGRADLDAPRYDLALLAPQLLGAAAAEVAPAAEERTSAATPAGELVSPRLFWGVLAVAVLVLLGMIVRLARRAEPFSARIRRAEALRRVQKDASKRDGFDRVPAGVLGPVQRIVCHLQKTIGFVHVAGGGDTQAHRDENPLRPRSRPEARRCWRGNVRRAPGHRRRPQSGATTTNSSPP